MALEEFILDLCEESVNGALLVRLPMHLHVAPFLTNLDFLAVPRLPIRPLDQSSFDCFQDMPKDLQQGATYCVWLDRSAEVREDPRECAANHCPGYLRVGQYWHADVATLGGPTSDITSQKTDRKRRNGVRCKPNSKVVEKSYSRR